MKLITEVNHDVTTKIVNEESGDKKFYIEGIFMQADIQNRNGRIYERSVLEPKVQKYVSEFVNPGRAVGELNHPPNPQVNLDKVSHRITELRWDGSNVVGRALVLNTPMGEIAKGLLEGGVQLGVSSRGMGSLVKKNGKTYVGDDFTLNTVDIVHDPSAGDAFVNGILEGKEYIWNNGMISEQEIEKIETEVKKAPMKNLNEMKIKALESFLSKLK